MSDNNNKYDEEQLRLMAEECIVIDENDNAIGHASKRKCHKVEEIKKGLLHRAFSVFLFNSENKLLLQKRAAAKITFPSCWTNTCCSHPLHFKEEMEEVDNLGVKRAAIRKLEHELGIENGSIGIDEFKFLTRIHYSAANGDEWGEHEIDHILFVKKDIPFKCNPNEVEECKYVDQNELRDLIENHEAQGLLISPWFNMIADEFLFRWWNSLDDIVSDKINFVQQHTINELHHNY